MGVKLITEKDFWMCTEGAVPAPLQGTHLSLKKKNIGVLITDHNVRETLRVVDRAYLLYDGQVLCSGDRETLLNDPQSRKFYLGEGFEA